ncbi:hypothetical protein ACFL3M_03465, partial [Patescibacteria group bacterium]
MEMILNRKIKIYSILFSLVVLFDWLLFVSGEMNKIVSWNSPNHFRWVVFSAVVLLLFSFLKSRWVGVI